MRSKAEPKAKTVEEAIARVREDIILAWCYDWQWPWSTNGTAGANAESFTEIDNNAEDL
jgi:hypothetical protein